MVTGCHDRLTSAFGFMSGPSLSSCRAQPMPGYQGGLATTTTRDDSAASPTAGTRRRPEGNALLPRQDGRRTRPHVGLGVMVRRGEVGGDRGQEGWIFRLVSWRSGFAVGVIVAVRGPHGVAGGEPPDTDSQNTSSDPPAQFVIGWNGPTTAGTVWSRNYESKDFRIGGSVGIQQAGGLLAARITMPG